MKRKAAQQATMRPTSKSNTRDAAESLAIQGLGFLASDMERLEPFLAQTGLAPDSLRAAAAEPGFLAGVLDHIAGSERLLLEFAEEAGIDPSRIGVARDALSGPPPAWGP